MELLESLILSGRIADIMLGVMVLEVLAIAIYRRKRGGGIALKPLVLNIGAGGSLILALRASLSGAGWPLIAVCLVLSLVFHVADQAGRWE